MANSPIFELFELICVELAAIPVQVISVDRIEPDVLEDIKVAVGLTDDAAAFRKALVQLQEHFAERGALPPYVIDHALLEFTATDREYIEFIAFANNRRGLGGAPAKDFEVRTLARLRTRLTGDLLRVGVPRKRLKKKKDILPYLMKLGFESDCLEPTDQDGGLDILWLPPLGVAPMRPLVSFQCKNSYFNEAEANESVGRVDRTLGRHTHIRKDHMKFVVFNDYIDHPQHLKKGKARPYLPLGLTDLATLTAAGLDDVL